jgi:hypothetical protein
MRGRSVLVLAAVVALVAACALPVSPLPSSSRSETPPSLSPSAAPTLALAPPPPAIEPWTAVPIGEEGVPLELIARPDGGLLVVGYDGSGDQPRAWLGEDEVTWRTAADVPAAPDGEYRHLGHVVWTGTQYVAAGSAGVLGSEEFHTATWTSPDGDAWRPVAELDGILLELLAGGPGVLAVGTRYGSSHYNGAVAWTSTDGVAWAEAPEIPNGSEAAMVDVVAFEGGFISVGGRGDELGDLEAAAWRSEDGVRWTAIELDPRIPGQAFSDVTVIDGRLVAAASAQVRPPDLWSGAIWSSADGAAWELDYRRDCCGEFADLTAGPDPMGLLMWHEPDGPYAAAIVERLAGEWALAGAPDDPSIAWMALTEIESGLYGLAARDGLQVPLLQVPPGR